VNSSVTQTRTSTYRPKRAALNWVDYLVIAATAMTFLTVVAANDPHVARAQSRLTLLSASELSEQVSQVASEPGMIKARIGLSRIGL
jgi:hypothetical protein